MACAAMDNHFMYTLVDMRVVNDRRFLFKIAVRRTPHSFSRCPCAHFPVFGWCSRCFSCSLNNLSFLLQRGKSSRNTVLDRSQHLAEQCRDVVVMDSDDEFEDANDDVMDDDDIFGGGSGAR